MPPGFCHTCASRVTLPNWERGSGDGCRLRQDRKLSGSLGCQLITALCGCQGKGIRFSSGSHGSSDQPLLLFGTFHIVVLADLMVDQKESNCLSLFPIPFFPGAIKLKLLNSRILF